MAAVGLVAALASSVVAVVPRRTVAETAAPEPPRVFVDTTYPSSSPGGRTHTVAAGGDLQRALNDARPGDVIVLEARATFAGPFTLPAKPGAEWIVIRTSAPDSVLPAPGTRVDPSHANLMAKLTAASGPVVTTAPGAHHYRFVGIEMLPRNGTFVHNLVLLGQGGSAADMVPHHIVFDRCYLHGDPRKGARRGIALNSAHTAVVDSYLSDFKEAGADSQALAGWNGPGPFKIVNNYLEGAGENVMFGGADPTIRDLVPSDIEIRHNHIAKPLSWKAGDPTFAGTRWSVKNLLELKNARRVLIDGNLFERTWADAQVGFAILFTPRNQDGSAPWSAVQDVTFVNNVVRRTGAGINISGRDRTWPSGSQQTAHVLIKNNLFTEVGGPGWGNGQLFQVLYGTAHVVIDHNTGFHSGSVIVAEGTPNQGFVYRNNLTPHNGYGVTGTDTGIGNLTLRTYFPGAEFTKNVLAGPWPSADGAIIAMYSAYRNNFFAPSLEKVRFVDLAGGNYQLAPSSPYRRAGTDGRDVGVDLDAVRPALAAARGNGDATRMHGATCCRKGG
jgi:hypothetical protein